MWHHSDSRCDSKDSRTGPNPVLEGYNPPGTPCSLEKAIFSLVGEKTWMRVNVPSVTSVIYPITA